MKSQTPTTLGTLVVVAIRGRHLPDRVTLGKNSPFVTLTYGLSKKQTRVIERGGQAPEWDEEFRFDIPKDTDDAWADETAIISRTGGVTAAVENGVPIKRSSSKSTLTLNAGRKALRVACFADDAKSPKMIGEAVLDLSHVFKKGEHDLWVRLEHKGRFAGEISLELTFYSHAIPPTGRITREHSQHKRGIAPLATSSSISRGMMQMSLGGEEAIVGEDRARLFQLENEAHHSSDQRRHSTNDLNYLRQGSDAAHLSFSQSGITYEQSPSSLHYNAIPQYSDQYPANQYPQHRHFEARPLPPTPPSLQYQTPSVSYDYPQQPITYSPQPYSLSQQYPSYIPDVHPQSYDRGMRASDSYPDLQSDRAYYGDYAPPGPPTTYAESPSAYSHSQSPIWAPIALPPPPPPGLLPFADLVNSYALAATPPPLPTLPSSRSYPYIANPQSQNQLQYSTRNQQW